MTTKEMLDKVVAILKSKNIDVYFVNTNQDGIEIGELKDGKITLNINSRDEISQIFTMAHLFGHYCQFMNYDKYKHLVETVERPAPLKLSNNFRRIFWNYEKEAFGIGKSLMMEAFVVSDEIDNMYQTFMLVDFEHFWDYITTGDNEGIKEFNRQLEKKYGQNLKFDKHIQPIHFTEFLKNKSIEAKVTIH